MARLLFTCTLLVMADGGGGGGDGKRSWHKEREISPASDEEKLLLPYVAHALALFFLRRVLRLLRTLLIRSPPHPALPRYRRAR